MNNDDPARDLKPGVMYVADTPPAAPHALVGITRPDEGQTRGQCACGYRTPELLDYFDVTQDLIMHAYHAGWADAMSHENPPEEP